MMGIGEDEGIDDFCIDSRQPVTSFFLVVMVKQTMYETRLKPNSVVYRKKRGNSLE